MKDSKPLSYWIAWALILLFVIFVVRLFWKSAVSLPTSPDVELEALEYDYPITDPFEPPLFDRSYYDQFGDCVKC